MLGLLFVSERVGDSEAVRLTVERRGRNPSATFDEQTTLAFVVAMHGFGDEEGEETTEMP